MDLKVLVASLGLPADSTEAQVLAHLDGLKKSASDATLWKARAEDNLQQLEKRASLSKENETLKADIFFVKLKAAYKITAAEETALKGMYLSGDQGKKAVEDLIAARADSEYMTRVQSLHNVKEAPNDPAAEVESRARELMAKDASLDLGKAMSAALKADFELQARYDARYSGRKVGA